MEVRGRGYHAMCLAEKHLWREEGFDESEQMAEAWTVTVERQVDSAT